MFVDYTIVCIYIDVIYRLSQYKLYVCYFHLDKETIQVPEGTFISSPLLSLRTHSERADECFIASFVHQCFL